ncbi:SEFIR domain-containing protein [Actinokineospora alba]|uniref:SEFIR domain-containing protein n=1 Tax=Actinokineospora alba TaxID=504798 RepID=UPI0010E298E3|nr:SEFIR domain-containing protein [Actinokineospora alba]TDP70450.1 NPCBM/NEW2 domain-containing protein [Actinokineospora alba]
MTNGNHSAREPEDAAPRVFVSYSHDTPEHQQQVHRLATFLRMRMGLDVHVDLWYDNVRRDWSLWAVEQLSEADFILVIASPKFKQRADGMAAPHEGRGAQFEAAILRDNLTRNLKEQTERILPVVLPGRSVEEIPTFLNAYSTTRYEIREFTEDGVADLIAAITGEGRHKMPERGIWRGNAQAIAATPVTGALTVARMHWLLSTPDVRLGDAVFEGVRYADSIVMRPSSMSTEAIGFLDVDLGGRFQTMRSAIGVLDDASERSQVGLFRVHVDGVVQLQRQVSHGKPDLIKVDVAGALRLRLEMSRPWITVAGDLAERSSRLPELAWGTPTLR